MTTNIAAATGPVVSDEIVAACAPWSAVVKAGQQLQIIDLNGNQAVDTLFYAAHDHAVRYSAQATVLGQGNIFLTTGSVLRAADGTALMTIVADEVGNHDTIAGACSKESNTLRYGHHTVHQHACAENFLAEATKWGMGKRDIVLERELLHERAGRVRRHPRHRRRTVGARQVADVARRHRHLGPGVELPADQQPVQRVRPDAGTDGHHGPRAMTTTIEVLRPGLLTSVQDWPGRIGYWHIGVPPSGPMDDLSFRIGNRVLGNAEGVAGLECTRGGPALRFPDGGRVCVTGAPVTVTVDGTAVPQWQSVDVAAGRRARRRHAERTWHAVLRAGGRRHRRTRIPRQHCHIHDGRVRRALPAARCATATR